jgi:hypothetical protein
VLALLVVFLSLGSLVMLAALAGVVWYLWPRTQPVSSINAVAPNNLVPEAPPHEPVESFDSFDATTAPGATVTAVLAHPSLHEKYFDEFDISPQGSVVVRAGKSLYDMTSGEMLTRDADKVESFAFVRGALVAVTADGKLNVWSEGGLERIGDAPYRQARLRSTESGGRLLIYGGDTDYGLSSFSAATGTQALCQSPEKILAAAGEGGHDLFSVGRAVFKLDAAGEPRLLIKLPESKGDVVGLTLSGDAVYFSTAKAVYALRGGIAMPLVIGIGGPLRTTAQGLLVLDTKRGRIFRVEQGQGK